MRLSLRSRALDMNAELQEALAADDFDAANIETVFNDLDRQLTGLTGEREGIELAVAIEKFGENPDAAPSFLAKADPFRALVVKSPKKAAARLEELEELISDLQPKWALARHQRQLAREERAKKLAAGFYPRHRKLVSGIAQALESLSAAVAAEQDLHKEFEARMSGLPFALNDYGGLWRSVLLNDPRSAASTWVRAAKNMGYLDE